MAYGYAKAIQNRIGAAPDGTIFIVSDFSDVADSETIRRNLNRLVQAGTLGERKSCRTVISISGICLIIWTDND